MLKSGYYTEPSVNELNGMGEAQLSAVEGFKVGRQGCGFVQWTGAIDTRGLKLERLVRIAPKQVEVFAAPEPGDEDEKKAGDAGAVRIGEQRQRLNTGALVLIEKVFPPEAVRSDIDKVARFRRKVQRTTEKRGAHFVSYGENNGEWQFRVDNFN